MSIALGATILLSAALSASGSAEAALMDPTSNQCAVAYLAAQSEKERLQGASYKNEQTDSLLNFIDNGRSIDYRARAEEVRKKHEASWNDSEKAPWMEVSSLNKVFFVEGTMATSDYYFSPATVFQTQRAIFERLPSCDRTHGFKPAAGALPTHDAVILHFKSQAEKRIEQDNARRDALDDTQCAIRYWVAANSAGTSSSEQQQARQLASHAAKKVLGAQPQMTQERLLTVIQRQGMEYGQKLSNSDNAKTFRDDILTCTARYQYEVDQKGAPEKAAQ